MPAKKLPGINRAKTQKQRKGYLDLSVRVPVEYVLVPHALMNIPAGAIPRFSNGIKIHLLEHLAPQG